MWYAMLAAASAAAKKMRISDPQRRNRRNPRDPDTADDAPNPDFDFGPMPSTLELSRPRGTDRVASHLMLILIVVALVPITLMVLVVAFLLIFR